MFRLHTPILNDATLGSFGPRDGLVVVDAELEPDYVNVVAGEDSVDDPGDLPARSEHVDDIDDFLDFLKRVIGPSA